MSSRTCQLCGGVLYGRADKRYCSTTCRRDACRIRRRTVHHHGHTFVGSEISASLSIEKYLIPRLERKLGPDHRTIRDAQQAATTTNEAELEQLAETMRYVLDSSA